MNPNEINFDLPDLEAFSFKILFPFTALLEFLQI